jgi:hypothetical protein
VKLKCRIESASEGFDGNMTLTLKIDRYSRNDLRQGYDTLVGKEPDCSLKKHREKRSLDANAYLWVLCTKLAEVLKVTKEEVYREQIRRSAVCMVLQMDTIQLADIETRLEGMGTGWFCEMLDIGTDGTHTVAVYYGSSTYSTGEMKRLLDSTIEECKLQGIQTETPDEVALMLERMKDI